MNVQMAVERLQELQQLHQNLKEEVVKLERRAYLTPDEQRHLTELKKQKLAAKDELYGIRQRS
jgi:hypothetical protein